MRERGGLILFLAILSAVDSQILQDFNKCVKDGNRFTIKSCIGRTAINFLQSVEEHDNYTVFEDFVAERDDKMASRSIINFLDQDPIDFRGILENAGAMFSQRSLQWRLDKIYPGLMFKIGPSADSNSIAEFLMDPEIDDRLSSTDEPSTARILAKSYLLPLLLGLKFNLVTLVPLVFTGVVLLLKKSLLLVKFAIFLTSIFGFGGLASFGGHLGGYGHSPLFHGYKHGYGLGYESHFPGKLGLVGNYESDVLNHDLDYEKKSQNNDFGMSKEIVTPSTPSPDRFYDFEKSTMLNDRKARLIAERKDINDYIQEWDGWHVIRPDK